MCHVLLIRNNIYLPMLNPRNASNQRGQYLGLAGGVALGLIATLAAWTMDDPVGNLLALPPYSAWGPFAHGMSQLGEWWVIGPLGLASALIAGFWRRKDLARGILVVACTALLSGGTATVLLTMIGRTRPNADSPQGFYGMRYQGKWIFGRYQYASFPSGHSATAVGLVAAVSLLDRKAVLLGVPYATLVCWSRIAQGSHHFSDVIAATCLGVIAAVLFAPWLHSILLRLGIGNVSLIPEKRAAHQA